MTKIPPATTLEYSGLSAMKARSKCWTSSLTPTMARTTKAVSIATRQRFIRGRHFDIGTTGTEMRVVPFDSSRGPGRTVATER